MKNKKLILTLLPLLALTACNKSAYQLELKVATPSGSPATALYKYLNDTEHLEVNSDGNNVIAYFTTTETAKKKDIIFAPTNAGIGAINKGANFKIAATITFGYFFLLSTGKDKDEVLNEGDKVTAFQQNGVAGKLFTYLYGDLNLDIDWKTSAVNVKDAILGDKDFDASYVMLAQPVVNAVLGAKSEFKIKDNMQEVYKTKTGHDIAQASIFINNDVVKEPANKFLSAVESDIEELLAYYGCYRVSIKDYEDALFSGKLTASKEALIKLLKNNNQIGLGYIDALENKESIDTFIKAVGLEESNEEIYYRADK